MKTFAGITLAYVEHLDVPGLVNVTTEAGEQYKELTIFQLGSLAQWKGWTLVPAK